MGHYTTIARFARFAASHKNQRSIRRPHATADSAGPDVEAGFVCPRCGDESVAPCECTHCRIAFVSTADHVLVPRSAGRHSLPPTPFVRAGLYVVETFTPQTALKLRERRRFRRARRKVATTTPIDIAELPTEARTVAHVRGRIHVAPPGGDDPRVSVTDATGVAILALGAELSVYDADGERFALGTGDLVDVVGFGRRHANPVAGYRDSLGPFVFDGDHGVDVWIRDED